MIKKKNMWFIAIGEPTPIPVNFNDLHRCGQLAYQFHVEGNDVTWFTSNFDHFNKEFVNAEESKILKYSHDNKNFKINFLKARPYKKNISLSRFINHYLISKEFKKEIKFLKKPDIIYVSFPSIELAYEAVRFGKINNIPVVVDFRDLWPDIFLTALPKILHPFAMVALLPWYIQRKYIFKNAKSIIAISDGFLKFAQKNSCNRYTNHDLVFNKSYNSNLNLSIKVENNKFQVIYFGAISRNKTHLSSVIEVFNKLDENYELIICGDGDDLDYYKEISSEKISFKGFVSKNQLDKIISECNLGIIPLRSRIDFKKALPNKAIEYMSYGVPILTSLDGDLRKFIEKNKVGIFYSNKDDLKKSLSILSTNDKLLNEFSENASKTFLQNFDFEKNFTKLDKHFQLLIDEKN